MNIPNDVLQEIIINKIKLFTKENYFKFFANILLELSRNILAFQKKASLSLSISSTPKDKIHKSWWQIIARLIIPINDSNSNINIKIEDEYDIELNPLCFEYLKNLCHMKIRQLSILSMTEQIPLRRIVPLYLNLCEKQIKINREKQLGIYDIEKENNYTKIAKKAPHFGNQNFQNSFMNRTQIKINQKKVGGKNMPSIQQLDYNNSFTRLFIGETDEDSIRERYLSNMVVKKHKQLHLLNNYMDLSTMYLKRMYYKLFKKEGGKGVMDKDMINVINQFENDHKKVENFQRNAAISDKAHNFDYMKNQLLLELQNQKQKYIKLTKKKKNKNVFSNFSVSRNNEVSKVNHEPRSSYYFKGKTRPKSQANSINDASRTYSDVLFMDKKFDNSLKNNKYKQMKYSYSVLGSSNNKKYGNRLLRSSSSVSKKYNYDYRWNNGSIYLDKRKKYYLKDYMNKNDFFFSKL